jgi:hypothetical protein
MSTTGAYHDTNRGSDLDSYPQGLKALLDSNNLSVERGPLLPRIPPRRVGWRGPHATPPHRSRWLGTAREQGNGDAQRPVARKHRVSPLQVPVWVDTIIRHDWRVGESDTMAIDGTARPLAASQTEPEPWPPQHPEPETRALYQAEQLDRRTFFGMRLRTPRLLLPRATAARPQKSGITTGRIGEPVAPRSLMQAPKKANS